MIERDCGALGDIKVEKNVFEFSVMLMESLARVDFPKEWTDLNDYLISTLDGIISAMQNNQFEIEQQQDLFTFTKIYLAIMKVQNTKKAAVTRVPFLKIAPAHMDRMFSLYQMSQLDYSTIDQVTDL